MGTAITGMVSGVSLLPSSVETLFAESGTPGTFPDLVGVLGGEPGQMFDRGIAALGGIKRFVKPNQTVVVKPNIGWNTEPERAANTNPDLIKQIVAQALSAGAKKVYVFDNTCNVWHKCYERSGIKKAVATAGGKLVPGNNERSYQKIQIPNGKVLTRAKAHDLFLDSDVVINVPVLKSHGSTKLTIGMKNLMGAVWDRRWWHAHDLHQCIADFASFRLPDLTVVDAYRVMKKNGPRGVSKNDVVMMRGQILSADPVAADAAAAKLFGMNPEDISYINIAHKMRIGNMELSKQNISRIRI